MDITDELFLEEIRNWLGILPVEFVIIVFSLIQEGFLINCCLQHLRQHITIEWVSLTCHLLKLK